LLLLLAESLLLLLLLLFLGFAIAIAIASGSVLLAASVTAFGEALLPLQLSTLTLR
jgi:hypothetical protein